MWADGILDHAATAVWTQFLTIPLYKPAPQGGQPGVWLIELREALINIVESTKVVEIHAVLKVAF